MTLGREALTIGRTPAQAASRADKPRWPIADFRSYGNVGTRSGSVKPRPNSKVISGLADRFRLTLYDAAYLELAHRSSLPLASLDEELCAAGRALGVPVLGTAT
jgi:predicted nucleic acid-binding protein